MAIGAYVLIEAEPGRTGDIAGALSKLEGVKQVHVITGPYDLIVYFERPDVGQITHAVTDFIQKIAGVRKTMTCIATAP